MYISKLSTLAAALLVSVAANSQSIKTSEISPASQLEALGMSANHRYIVGLNVASYTGFIWDTETDEVNWNDGDYANCDFRAVTNDGTAYGILGLDDMVTTNASTFDVTGAVTTIDNDMSQIFAVTPDGSVAVGCLLDDMWLPTACIWKSGVRTILPCPTSEECGFNNDGANAQFVSADGKVIAGYLQDDHSSRPAIIWREQADGTYAYDVISKDKWELTFGEGKTYLEFQPLGISSNGKWLCLAAQKEGEYSMPTKEFIIRMNLETGEIIEPVINDMVDFMEPTSDSFYPTSIADDGTCIGCLRDNIGLCRGVIWRAGESAPRLITDVLPELEILQTFDEFMNCPISITADGKYIGGYALPLSETDMGLDYDFQSYLISLSSEDDGITMIKTQRIPGTRHNVNGMAVSAGMRGIIIENNRKYYSR